MSVFKEKAKKRNPKSAMSSPKKRKEKLEQNFFCPQILQTYIVRSKIGS